MGSNDRQTRTKDRAVPRMDRGGRVLTIAERFPGFRRPNRKVRPRDRRDHGGVGGHASVFAGKRGTAAPLCRRPGEETPHRGRRGDNCPGATRHPGSEPGTSQRWFVPMHSVGCRFPRGPRAMCEVNVDQLHHRAADFETAAALGEPLGKLAPLPPQRGHREFAQHVLEDLQQRVDLLILGEDRDRRQRGLESGHEMTVRPHGRTAKPPQRRPWRTWDGDRVMGRGASGVRQAQ